MERGVKCPVQFQAVMMLAVLLFSLQVPEASAQEDEEVQRRCYCNTGASCVDNECTLPGHGASCLVASHRHVTNSSDVQVEWFCLHDFLTCLASNGDNYISHVECCDDGDFCNHCPNGSTLHLSFTEMSRLNITQECLAMHNVSTPPISVATPTGAETLAATAPSPGFPGHVTPPSVWVVPIVVISVVLVALVGIGVFACYYVASRRCKNRDEVVPDISYDDPEFSLNLSSAETTPGKMLLQPTTLANMLKLQKRLAKGGFAEVWRAEWDKMDYAVKIFRSTQYDSWEREGDIYRTAMLTHPHLLQFISMEKNDTSGLGMDYWLIFSFHQHGSLSSYLTSHTLSHHDCLRFLISIASGLSYLHQAVPTSTIVRKPVIAHRDLKTGNILVKDDMTCCIGDLGLAVTADDFAKGKKLPNPQQGTKRYMAPEILRGTVREKEVGSYVMADVYAFALITWEVSRRCQWHGGDIPPYEVAYHNVVPSDPSIEDMRKKVVDEGVRPPLDPAWKNNELLSLVSSMAQECWRELPERRLSSMRVRKNLMDLSIEMKQGLFKTNE